MTIRVIDKDESNILLFNLFQRFREFVRVPSEFRHEVTSMSDPFSDDDRPKFSEKVKFGQPDTETETDDVLEKRTKKKTKGRKRFQFLSIESI